MEWFLCLLEALYITTIAYPLTLDDMLFYIKGRIHLIRYEDLSVDPFGTTDHLLKFLDLAPNKLIETFIEQHTQTSRNTTETSTITANAIDTTTTLKDEKSKQGSNSLPYGTTRNSKSTAFKWKKKMKYKDISKVQKVCKKPMRMLGYNPMTDIIGNRDDDDFPIIVKSSQEIWSS